jgi:hypothetical protein
MGLIEPLAIATALPSGILPMGSSLMLSVPLVGILVIAAIALWHSVPRHRHARLRMLRLVHSTAG